MIRTLPFLLLLAACPPPEPPVPGDFKPEGEVLVTVDGNPVTQGMVDATLEQLPPQLKKQLEDAGQMSQVQEQIVSTELLYREALKRKLHETDAVKVTLALSTRSALADAMLDSIVEDRSTDERINKVYSESPKYKLEQVNLRVIAVESEEAATEIKGLVEGGGDFGKLAAERSKDPRSASKGGEIGWVSRRDLQGAFAPAVFAAKGGDVVGPFQAGPGFIIFKIDEKRAQIPLEDVKDEIKDGLKESIVVEYIEELKAEATITEAGDGTDGSDDTDAKPAAPAPGGAPAGGASGAEAGGH